MPLFPPSCALQAVLWMKKVPCRWMSVVWKHATSLCYSWANPQWYTLPHNLSPPLNPSLLFLISSLTSPYFTLTSPLYPLPFHPHFTLTSPSFHPHLPYHLLTPGTSIGCNEQHTGRFGASRNYRGIWGICSPSTRCKNNHYH